VRKRKRKLSKPARFMEKCTTHSGRATIYREVDERLILRLTNFKTSNGPDVHVVLIAAKDADDDANFLKNSTERIEFGVLKGNEGEQNYDILLERI
jgi:electron transfer DM13